MKKVRFTLLTLVLTLGIFGIAHSVYALPQSSPPPGEDSIPPHITKFYLPLTSSSLTVPIYSFVATDDVGVTGYMVKESSTTPSASASGWSESAPSTYTFTSAGLKTLYAWVKDAAGNISNMVSDRVSITLTDLPPPPPAVDLAMWSGQWFKITIKYEGYSFGNSNLGGPQGDPNLSQADATPQMAKDHENIVGYLKLTTWDPQQNTLQSELYQYDQNSNQWISDPLPLHYIGGTPADFLCWSQVNGDFTSRFVARIEEKGGSLKNATFTTLGGYYFEITKGSSSSSAESLAGGLSLTGRLVPVSKVPVPK